MKIKTMKSQKAMSPVVAAIILIAVTVAVAITVAAWFDAFSFSFLSKKATLTSYSVPPYPNATHVKWWIGNNSNHNQSSSMVSLPTDAWLEKPKEGIWFSVTYYQEIAPDWFKKLAEVTWEITVINR